MSIIKWIYKPCGNCPVQSEGWFLDTTYFYFRSRGARATIEFAGSEELWEKDIIEKSYVLKTTKLYKAGWLSHRYCKWLIYKGCLMYLLNFKSQK